MICNEVIYFHFCDAMGERNQWRKAKLKKNPISGFAIDHSHNKTNKKLIPRDGKEEEIDTWREKL